MENRKQSIVKKINMEWLHISHILTFSQMYFSSFLIPHYISIQPKLVDLRLI